jgi:hypothetical protein
LGAQAGERLVPPPAAKLTIRLRSREYMRIWKPSRPSEEKATRELSGATRGEMETVPRLVIECWLARRSPWPRSCRRQP